MAQVGTMASFRTVRLQTMMHPLGPDLRTVAVPMVLKVRSLKTSDEVDRHPIWSSAELTDFGRKLPRTRTFKAREIRQVDEAEVSALIVAFASAGTTKRRKQQVLPDCWIWEEPMAFILEPGRVVASWQGGIDTATQNYVDHLVSPAEYGPSRHLLPLTQEEIDGYRERAARAV